MHRALARHPTRAAADDADADDADAEGEGDADGGDADDELTDEGEDGVDIILDDLGGAP